MLSFFLLQNLVDETAKRDIAVEKDQKLIFPQDNAGLEFRDDLPTLLGGGLSLVPEKIEKTSPVISVFEDLVSNRVPSS